MPFVYFIHEEDNIAIFKIGKTSNHPGERLDQLQTGNFRRLRVYKWIEIENSTIVEEYLHTIFHDRKIRGEWFRVSTNEIDAECETIVQNNVNAKISGNWEEFGQKDYLIVKQNRVATGKYRGGDPVKAAARKMAFMEKKIAERVINS